MTAELIIDAVYKIACALCKRKGYHVKVELWQVEIILEATRLLLEKLENEERVDKTMPQVSRRSVP